MKPGNLTYLTNRVSYRTVKGLQYSDDYADHIERKRDREWFLKIQRLQKKTEQLKEQMELLSQKCLSQLNKTHQITTMTLDINNRLIQRKAESLEWEKEGTL